MKYLIWFIIGVIATGIHYLWVYTDPMMSNNSTIFVGLLIFSSAIFAWHKGGEHAYCKHYNSMEKMKWKSMFVAAFIFAVLNEAVIASSTTERFGTLTEYEQIDVWSGYTGIFNLIVFTSAAIYFWIGRLAGRKAAIESSAGRRG